MGLGDDMNICEQIKALPDRYVLGQWDGTKFVPASSELDAFSLKALAESHERLLAVLKDALPGLPETYGDESIEAMNAIEEAEKL